MVTPLSHNPTIAVTVRSLKGWFVMWKSESITGARLNDAVPAQSLSVRTILGLSRSPLQTVSDLSRNHGPIVRIPLPRMRAYLVCDPAAIHEILALSDRGADERIGSGRQALNLNRFPLGRLIGQAMINASGAQRQEHRRLTQSLYLHSHVRGYAETFARTAMERATAWAAGEPVDVYRELAQVGLLATSRTLLRRNSLQSCESAFSTHSTRHCAAAGAPSCPVAPCSIDCRCPPPAVGTPQPGNSGG